MIEDPRWSRTAVYTARWPGVHQIPDLRTALGMTRRLLRYSAVLVAEYHYKTGRRTLAF